MKRLLIFALLAACLSPWIHGAGASQAPRTERKAKQEEVLSADRELNAALVRGDVTTLERMLAKSFTLTYEAEVLLWNDGVPTPTSKTVRERKLTRDQVIAGLKSGALKFITLKWTGEAATLAGNPKSALGDRAVVSGWMHETSLQNGKDTSGDFVLNRTYLKADGRWQCAGASANPVLRQE